MSTNDKVSLEHRLADLLGICIDDDHDYIADVFGSLIDIAASPDDVTEYLVNFGGDGDDLQQFAIDLKKYKQGEEIKPATVTTEVKMEDEMPASAKPKVMQDEAAAQREKIKQREMEAREKQREEQELAKKKREDEEQRRRDMEAAAEVQKKQTSRWEKKKTLIQSSASAKQNVKPAPRSSSKVQSQQQQPKKKEPIVRKQPPKPQKGKPKNKECGCFGNKHAPLTNCLRCGRISCEKEEYDYCHCCGYLIQAFTSQNTGDTANIDSALRHKERLLEFDRTSASRTHVHDDQEDYFVASNSMWSTEQEQEQARLMEENRQKKLHERKKQVLNINL